MSKQKAQKLQEWIAYHALIIASTLPSIWVSMPREFQQSLPHNTLPIIAATTGLLGMIGKVCQIIAEKRAAKASTVPTPEKVSQK